MSNKRKYKKAFTLTELLVVVVVVGVLASVAIPKFNRVLETRRTTEAEELMSAVRTEQEKRCTFEKPYAGSFNKIGAIVASNLSNTAVYASSNYTYALKEQGIEASSAHKSYSLNIPSYKDGRVCCSGTYCDSLNRSYPKCDSLSLTYEDECKASPCALDPQSCDCNPNQCKCPSYSAEHCECTGTCYVPCVGETAQTCNACGQQTRTCNTANGTWSNWGVCSVASVSACAECTEGAIRGSQDCGNCGKQTTEKCVSGKWTISLGTCSGQGVCAMGTTKACGNGGEQICNSSCQWNACGGESIKCEGESEQSCGACEQKQTRICDSATGQWSAWGTCPADPVCSGEDSRECAEGEGSQTRSCTCGVWSMWDGECTVRKPCSETCAASEYRSPFTYEDEGECCLSKTPCPEEEIEGQKRTSVQYTQDGACYEPKKSCPGTCAASEYRSPFKYEEDGDCCLPKKPCPQACPSYPYEEERNPNVHFEEDGQCCVRPSYSAQNDIIGAVESGCSGAGIGNIVLCDGTVQWRTKFTQHELTPCSKRTRASCSQPTMLTHSIYNNDSSYDNEKGEAYCNGSSLSLSMCSTISGSLDEACTRRGYPGYLCVNYYFARGCTQVSPSKCGEDYQGKCVDWGSSGGGDLSYRMAAAHPVSVVKCVKR